MHLPGTDCHDLPLRKPSLESDFCPESAPRKEPLRVACFVKAGGHRRFQAGRCDSATSGSVPAPAYGTVSGLFRLNAVRSGHGYEFITEFSALFFGG